MSADPAILQLIPHRPPFLFVDEIVSESADGLVAKRTFRAEEDFYKGHYPNAPITPGVLLCEAVFQTGALFMARSMAGQGSQPGVPLLAKITDVRFRNPVFPGETIRTELWVDGSVVSFRALVAERNVVAMNNGRAEIK